MNSPAFFEKYEYPESTLIAKHHIYTVKVEMIRNYIWTSKDKDRITTLSDLVLNQKLSEIRCSLDANNEMFKNMRIYSKYTLKFSPLIHVLDKKKTNEKIKNREAFAWQICDLLIHSKRYGITVKNPNLQESLFSIFTPTSHTDCLWWKLRRQGETKD